MLENKIQQTQRRAVAWELQVADDKVLMDYKELEWNLAEVDSKLVYGKMQQAMKEKVLLVEMQISGKASHHTLVSPIWTTKMVFEPIKASETMQIKVK